MFLFYLSLQKKKIYIINIEVTRRDSDSSIYCEKYSFSKIFTILSSLQENITVLGNIPYNK